MLAQYYKMKLRHLLFSILFLSTHFLFAQDWITTEITDFTTIQFPKPTDYNETQSESIISTFTEDAIYSVSYRLFNDEQSAQIENGLIQHFYDGVVNGIIDASKAKLLEKETCKINGVEGVEVTYLAPPHPQIPSKRVKRVFYVNKYVIHINYWQITKDDAVAEKNKKRFFESFTIKKAIPTTQNTTNTALSDTKNLENNNLTEENSSNSNLLNWEGILTILILLAIIIGIILLIRYFKK